MIWVAPKESVDLEELEAVITEWGFTVDKYYCVDEAE